MATTDPLANPPPAASSHEAAEEPSFSPLAEAGPSPLALLFVPDRGMERQARVGRALRLFLFAWLCSILLGTALAYRVDAKSSTLRTLEMSGQLQTMSDRQVAEETHNAERVAVVMGLAKAVTSTPLQLGSASLALLGLVWFLRGHIKGSAVVPVAAGTLLPGAIVNLTDAVAALRHAAIPPGGVPLTPRSLSAILPFVGHPLLDPWLRLGNALDFFSLWAAVMLGFGVAAVGQLPKRRAVTGTLVAWICYQLLTCVAMKG